MEQVSTPPRNPNVEEAGDNAGTFTASLEASRGKKREKWCEKRQIRSAGGRSRPLDYTPRVNNDLFQALAGSPENWKQ